ncbi:hypothetical protein DPMN_051329 [Dreissena polymorpha]|uniref:Uncharacterized protein n=1 Tax=Dreissena polymorpha TaxID=45954 RepID=A0A9D4HNW2_DREPO|nr:hypothetical protein DPMN_051329 [Dreissena polymorpha]
MELWNTLGLWETCYQKRLIEEFRFVNKGIYCCKNILQLASNERSGFAKSNTLVEGMQKCDAGLKRRTRIVVQWTVQE